MRDFVRSEGIQRYFRLGEKLLTQSMRKRLRCLLKNGRYIVPSNSTIRRFLTGIDPEELDKAISLWVQKLTESKTPIAIDGKTMRGTSKKKNEQVHVLSAVYLNGPMFMTCLRKLAITILRKNNFNNIAEAFRRLWAKPHLAVNMVFA